MGCVMCVNRLEVKGGELGKETVRRETGSLGAGSDCASTRGMAGSITSSYTMPDRYVDIHTHTHTETQKHKNTLIKADLYQNTHSHTLNTFQS